MTVLPLPQYLGCDRKRVLEFCLFSQSLTPIKLDVIFNHASLSPKLDIFNFKLRDASVT